MALVRQLLMFVLVLSLSPGLPELLENLEHMVQDGHLAHAAVHDDGEDQAHAAHAALEAEHGCTPMNHMCGCHISVPVVLLEAPTVEAPAQAIPQALRNPVGGAPFVTRANAPPVPPPTA